MNKKAVVSFVIALVCSMSWGAGLYFDRAGATKLTLSSDGSVAQAVLVKQTPPGTPAAGTLLMERTGAKLWVYNTVSICGDVKPVAMTAPLTFENNDTKCKIQLSENGDLVGTETGLQQVETYDGSRTSVDKRDMNQVTEFESFGEGRVEYVRATNGTVTEKVIFYFKDHLGSTRAVVNEALALVEATRYYAYGEPKPIAYLLNTPPTLGTNIEATQKYVGKEFDEEGAVANVTTGMGLEYFGARYQ